MSALSLRLPDSIHKELKKIAKTDHVSINQFISLAVAEKISCLKTVDYTYKLKIATKPMKPNLSIGSTINFVH